MNCTSVDGKTVLYKYGLRTSINCPQRKWQEILKYKASYMLNRNILEILRYKASYMLNLVKGRMKHMYLKFGTDEYNNCR